MLKNILAIFLGLFIGIAVTFSGSGMAKEWFTEPSSLNFSQWQEVIRQAPAEFFIILLISYALGSLMGGVTTAFFVSTAKEAYAFLIGFILFVFSCVHIFCYRMPFWFELSTFFVFFPASWLGGKLVVSIQPDLIRFL
ncbi:hypothetical protein [Bacteroidetes bacterium endosymbiont of Geopemphigus sp.]|uniref:hypothetical protein n=1 Tax=Bacteroidetes bacterium endosymbiont of Geopemphigus sp. TaxID=2047937 RepID=UPI000CD24913|nr:hypothetical protein [Bacteroidetes bacterium endosymbiont of Geopemphigus sp.]